MTTTLERVTHMRPFALPVCATALAAACLLLSLPTGGSPAQAADVPRGATSTPRSAYPLAEPVEPVRLTRAMTDRPNIVLITTDDQSTADLDLMPLTRKWLSDRGVTLDGISPQPLCCPARAEMLTGQYAHNNGVRGNQGTYGGYDALRTKRTLATDLHGAGYETIFMGKFLNGYSKVHHAEQMPGWTSWNPTLDGIYDYDDFMVANDGLAVRHENSYQTDYFTELAEQKIAEVAPSARPFFLWQSFVAPHTASYDETETRNWSPPAPAARHQDAAPAAAPVSDPSYGEADVSDKPAHIRNREWTQVDDRAMGVLAAARAASLQSVDEGVSDIVAALRRSGELANTLIIFTSDNGYLLGQHRYHGKTLPYEPSISVPLLIRGPGIPPGVTRNQIGTTIDIAPTILAAAGVETDRPMDGRDLLPVLTAGRDSWTSVLLQVGPRTDKEEPFGWFYRGVRDSRWTYAHYLATGELELYDREHDPYQLRNVAYKPRYEDVVAEMARRLSILADCSGDACKSNFGPPPKPAERLSTGG